ncbi:hypothetical protein L9F63_010365, partial [Diploptera punctata]
CVFQLMFYLLCILRDPKLFLSLSLFFFFFGNIVQFFNIILYLNNYVNIFKFHCEPPM